MLARRPGQASASAGRASGTPALRLRNRPLRLTSAWLKVVTWPVTRLGCLGSSRQQPASPQSKSLGTRGVAFRTPTPATRSCCPLMNHALTSPWISSESPKFRPKSTLRQLIGNRSAGLWTRPPSIPASLPIPKRLILVSVGTHRSLILKSPLTASKPRRSIRSSPARPRSRQPLRPAMASPSTAISRR